MNVLAIGAHPDDVEYGCGGTLLKYKKKGYKISLLVLTNGEMGASPRQRLREQKKSSRLLNGKIYWGNFPDTDVQLTKKLINSIEKVIEKTKPDIVFVHTPSDTHQDHRNIAQATITASRYRRNVLFYEVPTTVDFSPTIFTDIGDVLNKKMELLKAHTSQVFETKVAELSILENARSCAIFRGFQNRVRFAEGFVPLRFTLNI